MKSSEQPVRSPLIDLGYRLGSAGLVIGVVLMVLGLATLFAFGNTAALIVEVGLRLTIGAAVLGLISFAMAAFSPAAPRPSANQPDSASRLQGR